MGTGTKRPVIILGGFLGSGKTTLLRRLLERSDAQGVAVIVNEFGEVGLDHHLVRRSAEQTVLIGGGCVCCTLREDLVQAMRDLLDADERGQIPRLTRVIVETTGLADPAPILFTLVTDPVLQHHFTVDGIVVTVDGINGPCHLDRHPESRKQVAVADQLIITKTDLVPPHNLEHLHERLVALNPEAEIMTAIFGDVDPARIFGARTRPISLAAQRGPLGSTSVHDGETQSLSLRVEKPLDWVAFGVWLSMLLHARGEDVLRVKALLNVSGVGSVVVNGVQHVIHPPEHLGWSDPDLASSITFIVRGIDPQVIAQSMQTFQNLAASMQGG